MRLVFDTNVVFSALLWRGKPHQLLEAVSQRSDTHLFSSPALLEELADVLARPMAAKRLALIGATASAVLADYRTVVEMVEPAVVPRVARDADGEQIVIAGDDDDLLAIGSYQSIDIINAAEALRYLEAGSD